MLFSKENGKYFLGVVNQSRASTVTALPWGSWRSTRKRPTERMFLIELYVVWEIVQCLTILGICRKLSKLKKKQTNLSGPHSGLKLLWMVQERIMQEF